MTLRKGTRLGPYEIVAAAGGGGMGEVYRGRDTRLDRTVAIKVLPSEFSQNAQLRLRLEREAKSIAALSHAHICTLYDVGREDGIDYLVMEYIEGETLTQKIARGALPIEQVIQYGIEIADALGRAHKGGIIHRDLKPGNIMLTRSGVKLLDFGLAKQGNVFHASAHSETANLQEPLTDTGAVVGTVQYMSPEQLEGREVDARTDIFALGCILYQMATGTHPFKADSQAGVIAAILNQDPPSISTRQPLAPRSFDRLVKTCLAKDPDDRIQTARDVQLQLSGISEDVAAPDRRVDRTQKSRGWLIASAAVLLAGLAGAVYWLSPRARPVRGEVARLDLAVPGRISDTFRNVAVSPDGKQVAALLNVDDVRHLHTRRIDARAWVRLPGTQGAIYPFFSPDGKSLGFFAAGKLKKIETGADAPIDLADVSAAAGGDWSAGGEIVYSSASAIYTIADRGGAIRRLTTPNAASGERSHRWPTFLPDGKGILFTIQSPAVTPSQCRVAVVPQSGGAHRTVYEGASDARYVHSGHLVFLRGAVIHTVPFDLRSLKATGAATPLPDRIEQHEWFGAASFGISASGVLVYSPVNRGEVERELISLDQNGSATLVSKARQAYQKPEVSPDGRYLVVGIEPATTDIWVNELARDVWTRLTSEATNTTPVWSSDGNTVFFSSNRGGAFEIYAIDLEGGAPRQLTRSKGWQDAWPASASADGKHLAFMTNNSTTRADIWMLNPSGGEAEPVLRSNAAESRFVFHPSGKWAAYTSDDSGRAEVYLQRFPLSGRRWKISVDGGDSVQWSDDGKTLYYLNGQKVMAVTVRLDPAVVIASPRLLFEDERFYVAFESWDVAPNGRIIMIRETQSDLPEHLVAVLNWTDSLR